MIIVGAKYNTTYRNMNITENTNNKLTNVGFIILYN